MTKAEAIRDPNSCLNKAEFDEPVFILRANDPVAAHVVRYWAACYVADKGVHSSHSAPTDAQMAKARQAMAVADSMHEWARRQARRTLPQMATEADVERAIASEGGQGG